MKKRDLGLVLLVLAALLLRGGPGGNGGRHPGAGGAEPRRCRTGSSPLPVPPVAQKTFKPGVSSWADYYVIDMRASQHQFNAGLGPATVWTYAQPGQAPVLLGPADRRPDRQADRRQIDQQPPDRPGGLPAQRLYRPDHRRVHGADRRRDHAHLHGGHSAARFDGTPMQWWTADGQKGEDYVTDTFAYVNDQPASLSWYHDHTIGVHAVQAVSGPRGRLPDLRQGRQRRHDQRPARVPTGYGKYHLPLVIQDKQFNDDGTLFYPTAADGGGSSAVAPDSGCRSSSPTRRSSTARRTRHPGRAAAQVPAAAAEWFAGPLLQPGLQREHRRRSALLGHRLRGRAPACWSRRPTSLSPPASVTT